MRRAPAIRRRNLAVAPITGAVPTPSPASLSLQSRTIRYCLRRTDITVTVVVVSRVMQEKRERWMELAALAADEQDPKKLSELVNEIDRLLKEKQDRLDRARIPSKPSE